MAKFTNCRLTKIRIDDDPMKMIEALSDACWYNDQPVAGFSWVAHRFLMEEARKLGITVLLTGQGADEQLAGYNKYFYFYLWHCFKFGLLDRGITLFFLYNSATHYFK